MPNISINGIQVNFPFKPYQVQINYMEKVIEALQTSQNAVLESPTGTGKTLSLLCSALAWREDQIKMFQNTQANLALWKTSQSNQSSECTYIPKIIYASRTHSQISQIVSELKRTTYGKKVHISVLGSRQQLCLHPGVANQESNQLMVHMCRTKVSKHICHFYNNVENAQKNQVFTSKVMDIEDLVKEGKKWNACPYYSVREISKQSDCAIIFTPYNYLFDKKSRKAQNLEIGGNVVIIDEAHNLEKHCEEASSFELTSLDVANCIEEVDDILVAANTMSNSGTVVEGHEEGATSELAQFKPDELALMKRLFLVLEETLDGIEVDESSKSVSKPGSFIFDFFAKVNLNFQTYSTLLELLDKIISYLSTLSNQFRTRGVALQKFSDIIKIIFSPLNAIDPSSKSRTDELATFYRVYVSETPPKKPAATDVWKSDAKIKNFRSLSYWCFTSGYAMKELVEHGVRNLILTSGTLTPMQTFISELRIPVPITISNDHVIDNHQVFIAALQKGSQGGRLMLTYATRGDLLLVEDIGRSLCMIAQATPGGMLVFFASYAAMTSFVTNWEEIGIMKELNGIKPVTVESNKRSEMHLTIDTYYSNIRTRKNAILFAVCRGKVSEGLDFANDNGRAVVILGIPFPPMLDPRVKLKMALLDDLRKKTHFKDMLTGTQWYSQQACRAVNQAIGRVIRHRHDYGAIILFDDRYAKRQQQAELPHWIKNQVNNFDDFSRSHRRLKSFFCSVISKDRFRLRNIEVDKSTPDSQNSIFGLDKSNINSKKRNCSQMLKNRPKFNEIREHLTSISGKSSDLSVCDVMSDFECCRKLYEESSASNSVIIKSQSFLSALNETNGEKGFDEINLNDLTSDKQITTPTQPQVAVCRKKIKLKNPGTPKDIFANTENNSPLPVNADEKNSNFDEMKLYNGSAKDFLQALKDNFTKHQFDCIKKSTSILKKTDDVAQFVRSISESLKDDQNKIPVLRMYLRFMKSSQKSYYRSLCNLELGFDVWEHHKRIYKE